MGQTANDMNNLMQHKDLDFRNQRQLWQTWLLT